LITQHARCRCRCVGLGVSSWMRRSAPLSVDKSRDVTQSINPLLSLWLLNSDLIRVLISHRLFPSFGVSRWRHLDHSLRPNLQLHNPSQFSRLHTTSLRDLGISMTPRAHRKSFSNCFCHRPRFFKPAFSLERHTSAVPVAPKDKPLRRPIRPSTPEVYLRGS
jgi:hypothetical protein